MLNSKEKELAKKEAEIYKMGLELEIAKELHEKRVGNWKYINETREKRREAQVEDAEKIGYMNGLRTAEEILFKIKDQQIELLKDLMVESIKALQSIQK